MGSDEMHIEPKTLKEYPWYLQPFFWNQKRRYGKVLKPGLLWARSPKVFMGLALLYGALDRRSSPLNSLLRSLITVRISQINWCSFCIDINSATLRKRGASEEKLEALDHWQQSDLFEKHEKVALEYAEAITRSDTKVSEELMQKVKGHFSDDEVIEMTALIAFQNMSSKFNAALAVPSEGFCKIPNEGTSQS